MAKIAANVGEDRRNRRELRLRRGAERLRVVLGLAVLAISCDGAGDGSPGSTTAGDGEGEEEGTAVADDDASSQTSSASPGDGTSSGHPADSGGSASESTTAAESPVEDLCPTATSEMECASLDPVCRWYPSHHVLDPATCMLDEPEYRCWATDPNGQTGCFDGPPAACEEIGVRPLYRETRGGLELLSNTEWLCNYNPLAPEGEPAWVECPVDEFRPAPDVCYCLCGGPPDPDTGG
jgi:hypothetical protein